MHLLEAANWLKINSSQKKETSSLSLDTKGYKYAFDCKTLVYQSLSPAWRQTGSEKAEKTCKLAK